MANEKILTGTCYWLGQKFGIDPTIIRVGFVVSIFAFGTGALAYLVLWIVKILENDNA